MTVFIIMLRCNNPRPKPICFYSSMVEQRADNSQTKFQFFLEVPIINNRKDGLMKFKDFLLFESKEIPYEKNPDIGWWKDKEKERGHHVVYHGTHKKNLPHILKHGINHKDPDTGMISVTHDPHTAHGYAAMSASGGEHNFRKAGKKPTTTAHEDRVVIKIHLPGDHPIDGHLRGNVGDKQDALTNKDKYDAHKRSGKEDHEHYMKTELRTSKEIPAKHIVGYMYRKKPL